MKMIRIILLGGTRFHSPDCTHHSNNRLDNFCFNQYSYNMVLKFELKTVIRTTMAFKTITYTITDNQQIETSLIQQCIWINSILSSYFVNIVNILVLNVAFTLLYFSLTLLIRTNCECCKLSNYNIYLLSLNV